MLQNDQRPDLLTCHCASHSKFIFADPLQMPRACHRFWKYHTTLTFVKAQNPLRLPLKIAIDCSKVVRTWCACFYREARPHAFFEKPSFQKCSEHEVLLTCSLGNVRPATARCTFSNISTSKSAPNMVCFVRFDFEMCFAPQTRTLFELFNFQKCVPNLRYFQNFDFPMCFGHSGAHFLISQHPPLWRAYYFSALRNHKTVEKQRVLQLFHALRSSFRTLSSLPLPTTVATSFNQLAPLFIAFILTGCAPTVFDYWNLHDTPILGTVPPKKTGKSESLRGFSWGTTRRRDSTSQKRCDILWPKQTLAAWTGTSWHVHGLFIHVHSWLFYNCFLLQVFWTQLFGHT